MNLEKLKTFCNRSRERYLDKVMLCNGKAVATNGWMLVVSNNNFGVKEPHNDGIKKYVDYLDSYDFSKCQEYSVEAPSYNTCSKCNGVGYTQIVECHECDGEGQVSAETDYNTYHGLECKTCNGDGRIPSLVGEKTECEHCGGDGRAVSFHDLPINLDGLAQISWDLYKKIKDLDQLKLGPCDFPASAAVVFSFDGGCGLLAEYRS